MTNGYIQADILGRPRGLKFGSLAAQNIISELATMGVAAGGNYSGPMMAAVIWWGLYNCAYVKREVLDITFEEVVDFVDENYSHDNELAPLFTEIVRTWEDSKASKLVLANLQKTLDEMAKKVKALTPPQGPTSTQ